MNLLLMRRLMMTPSDTYSTITGNAPLILPNAKSRKIKSLIQYGKCSQASTPTPASPVDIYCNNGALRYGKPVAITSGKIAAWISTNGAWAAASDSYSVCIPVEVGKSYAVKWSTTDTAVVGDIFRYGFTATPTPQTQTLSQVKRTSPQDLPSVVLTADYPYLVIQVGSSLGDSIFANGYLTVAEQIVYVDGTPEVLSAEGKNLIDPTTRTKPSNTMYRWYNATGFLLKANTTYTFSARSSEKTLNVYFYDFETTTSIKSSSTGAVTYTPTEDTKVFFTAYVASGIPEDVMPQLEYGSTATDYKPYITPQTASVVDLLSVSDYTDEQDIINGVTTRRVGIKVLDGTENVVASSTAGIWFIALEGALRVTGVNLMGLSTHFVGTSNDHALMPDNSVKYSVWSQTPENDACVIKMTSCATVADFKAYLAAQYATGTPVIVVYPLATETTEQVSPQSLSTNSGTNTITITANVSPVSLKVEYAKRE